MKKQIEALAPSTADVSKEIEAMKSFMEAHGLEVDPKFYDLIKAGDIIEVYAYPENTQIFCNNEFSKLCSYSREQMTTIPFPKLFWRADEDHRALMKRAAHVATNENGVVGWDLPNHELVEALHPRRRTFDMNLGHVAPCFDKNTKERKAWASMITVDLIFQWHEDLDPKP